jgi:hypothetical protein
VLAELTELIRTRTGDGERRHHAATICRLSRWIFWQTGEPKSKVEIVDAGHLSRPRKIPKKNSEKNQYWIRWRNPASSGGTERGPGNRLGLSQSRACRAAHATEKRSEGIMAG